MQWRRGMLSATVPLTTRSAAYVLATHTLPFNTMPLLNWSSTRFWPTPTHHIHKLQTVPESDAWSVATSTDLQNVRGAREAWSVATSNDLQNVKGAASRRVSRETLVWWWHVEQLLWQRFSQNWNSLPQAPVQVPTLDTVLRVSRHHKWIRLYCLFLVACLQFSLTSSADHRTLVSVTVDCEWKQGKKKTIKPRSGTQPITNWIAGAPLYMQIF